MAVKRLRDPLSRFQLNLLAETLRPHLPTCRLPDFSVTTSRVQAQVPPAWHFVYFPSVYDERALFSDGYDPVLVPGNNLLNGSSRRRWRGGQITFNAPLITDLPATCTVTESVNIQGTGIDLDTGFEHIDESTFRVMSNDESTESLAAVVEERHLLYLPQAKGLEEIPTRSVRSKLFFKRNL